MARFQREAEVLRARPSQFGSIYSLVESGDKQALVHGATLDERIAERPLPSDKAVNMARQIISALASWPSSRQP